MEWLWEHDLCVNLWSRVIKIVTGKKLQIPYWCCFNFKKNMQICFWVMDLISSEEDRHLFVGCGFCFNEDLMTTYLKFSVVLQRCAILRWYICGKAPNFLHILCVYIFGILFVHILGFLLHTRCILCVSHWMLWLFCSLTMYWINVLSCLHFFRLYKMYYELTLNGVR